MPRSKGLVIVNTGDGKGKSTAAFGMLLRASGHGMRTLIVQFVKSATNTGEIQALEKLDGVEINVMGLGFLGGKDVPKEKHAEAARKAYEYSKGVLASGDYQMMVLDEILFAVKEGLLEEDDILQLISLKPEDTHLVLTGRGCPRSVIEKADIVTEMKEVKHPFSAGTKAAKGVEY